MTRKRKWLLASVLVLAAAGTWAALNTTALKAKYAAYQLRTATTDEARASAADRLTALGDSGLAQLLAFVRAGNDSCRGAAAGAIDRHLTAQTDDTRANAMASHILDSFGSCDDAGRRAVLELLPTILKRTGAGHAASCREAVAAGLRLPDADTRVLAVRLALHPEVKLRAELLPLLNDPEAAVRRAALFAIGSAAEGEPTIADEDLFRWLHDPDEGVRKACRDVLVQRERTETEIALGRRLTSPDASERLKLLLDLRYDDDVADPEPWLERLSRDSEPAVRAGAVRVAAELTTDRRRTCPPWVARVANADPDPTVRRVARFFQGVPFRAGDVRPAGGP